MGQRLEIFGRDDCRFCVGAVAFCEKRRLPYVYRNLSEDPELADELTLRIGTRVMPTITVPQIFIGEHRIGGFDDLKRSFAVVQQILFGA